MGCLLSMGAYYPDSTVYSHILTYTHTLTHTYSYMHTHSHSHTLTLTLTLTQITLEGMKSNHDEIALQGIEFWSTVCDEEADLAIEAAEVRGLIPVDSFPDTDTSSLIPRITG